MEIFLDGISEGRLAAFDVPKNRPILSRRGLHDISHSSLHRKERVDSGLALDGTLEFGLVR
jgi:hypothetical protein